ncbi:hypothetical protein K788_0006994 (plasmid) [Paraburkholderia caribensis MBA4]|uniref:Uncharacterized protein n=1 Tax=Paraburkholderia caribensis MBA4 TaxID=1323664 RepID=A0A0P0RPM0_9BURK|nr:hypothetical protein K788_0006994 [Paraburkholderia caribensis MBA4]
MCHLCVPRCDVPCIPQKHCAASVVRFRYHLPIRIKSQNIKEQMSNSGCSFRVSKSSNLPPPIR